MYNILTGNCKIDFIKWYADNKWQHTETIEYPILKTFTKLHPLFQQGVLLGFFREQGISITIRFGITAGYYCEISEDDESDDIILTDFENYNTALTEAIEKANDIYNKQ